MPVQCAPSILPPLIPPLPPVLPPQFLALPDQAKNPLHPQQMVLWVGAPGKSKTRSHNKSQQRADKARRCA
jgi:hypothetical protein